MHLSDPVCSSISIKLGATVCMQAICCE